mmetsp:Transcript_69240/g.122494  ORF Transcript_69240/g.122494 Transcript_69240/m.122494 type:complete len:247 (+) Transcript_69240:278-1018(+)
MDDTGVLISASREHILPTASLVGVEHSLPLHGGTKKIGGDLGRLLERAAAWVHKAVFLLAEVRLFAFHGTCWIVVHVPSLTSSSSFSWEHHLLATNIELHAAGKVVETNATASITTKSSRIFNFTLLVTGRVRPEEWSIVIPGRWNIGRHSWKHLDVASPWIYVAPRLCTPSLSLSRASILAVARIPAIIPSLTSATQISWIVLKALSQENHGGALNIVEANAGAFWPAIRDCSCLCLLFLWSLLA